MKKIIFLFFILYSFLNSSENNLPLIKEHQKEYTKEIESEAKIILTIAKNIVLKKEKISLFIPEINDIEKSTYSNLFNIVNNCNNADFIFLKNEKADISICENEKKIFFTNNYDFLLKNKKFIGAFFWSKSRPNIVFIKDRLSQNNIELPETYNKFIEEL